MGFPENLDRGGIALFTLFNFEGEQLDLFYKDFADLDFNLYLLSISTTLTFYPIPIPVLPLRTTQSSPLQQHSDKPPLSSLLTNPLIQPT